MDATEITESLFDIARRFDEMGLPLDDRRMMLSRKHVDTLKDETDIFESDGFILAGFRFDGVNEEGVSFCYFGPRVDVSDSLPSR